MSAHCPYRCKHSNNMRIEHHEPRDYYETPEQKLRKNIIHYGEVVRISPHYFWPLVQSSRCTQDPLQELPRLANQIFEHTPTNVPAVTEAFRIGCVCLCFWSQNHATWIEDLAPSMAGNSTLLHYPYSSTLSCVLNTPVVSQNNLSRSHTMRHCCGSCMTAPSPKK